MPAKEFRWIFDGWASATITINSLAANGARQCTAIANPNNRPRAKVEPIFKSNTAPTAGTIYEQFLLFSDGTQRDDNAGASDAAITIHNAALLGTIANDNGGATSVYSLIFDTAPFGLLGSEFVLAMRNSTNQALNSSGNALKYNLAVGQLQA